MSARALFLAAAVALTMAADLPTDDSLPVDAKSYISADLRQHQDTLAALFVAINLSGYPCHSLSAVYPLFWGAGYRVVCDEAARLYNVDRAWVVTKYGR